MMIRPLLLFLLLYLLTACGESKTFDLRAPAASTKTLQPWKSDINRWSWDGDTPELLLGASSYEAPFLEKAWKEELNYLKKTGGNYVRTSLPAFTGENAPSITSSSAPGVTEDFDKTDYWQKLETFINYAEEHGIVVEIQVWDLENIAQKWDSVFWSASTSGLEDEYLEEGHPFFRTIPGSMGYKTDYEDALFKQETFVSLLMTHTLRFQNIIYNVQVPDNHLIPWMVHWAKYIEARAKEEGKTANVNAGIVPNRRINVARFNQSLLEGAAVAFHRPKPNGNGMNGVAQASIRGARVVERHLKFHELRPAPELLLDDNTEATAATDGKGNYLIYLPSAGQVNLSPDWDEQVPVDVTVVGYLGTQRTEVLQPPYGDSFKLYTEEEKGGWMILKPQRQ